MVSVDLSMKSKNAAFSWGGVGALINIKIDTYQRERMYIIHTLHVRRRERVFHSASAKRSQARLIIDVVVVVVRRVHSLRR